MFLLLMKGIYKRASGTRGSLRKRKVRQVDKDAVGLQCVDKKVSPGVDSNLVKLRSSGCVVHCFRPPHEQTHGSRIPFLLNANCVLSSENCTRNKLSTPTVLKEQFEPWEFDTRSRSEPMDRVNRFGMANLLFHGCLQKIPGKKT